jgi:hypothetical protein
MRPWSTATAAAIFCKRVVAMLCVRWCWCCCCCCCCRYLAAAAMMQLRGEVAQLQAAIAVKLLFGQDAQGLCDPLFCAVVVFVCPSHTIRRPLGPRSPWPAQENTQPLRPPAAPNPRAAHRSTSRCCTTCYCCQSRQQPDQHQACVITRLGSAGHARTAHAGHRRLPTNSNTRA